MNRTHNFNAGPAVLPLSVLEQAQGELLNYRGSGMSVMELSHRSAHFEGIIQQAEADLRTLLGIPDNYTVLFLQGGATLQFAMLARNFIPNEGSADYVLTGSWAKAAIKEAEKRGRVRAVGSTETDNFNHVPSQSGLDLDPKAAFLHFTSNETIHGVEFPTEPEPLAGVPLICDMSSNILSKPIDVSKYGVIYAGAQKNIGPAGLTIVIIRDDLIGKGVPT
ncbi:MAG: 3-phosphoserine/phosphohydroxythreonine transaminase, partial [Chloroflexota bacterium]